MLLGILEGFDDVEVERIAIGAGFLGTVEDADALHGLRHDVHEVLHAEGTIEVHSDETELLASLVLLVDDGLDDVVDGAHGDDDIGGILGAVVNERSILTTRDAAHLLHILGHDVGQSVVVLVLQFAGLEVDVRVLGGTTGYGVLRIEGAFAVFLEGLLVDELAEFLHVGSLDLLDFVRGTEAVEEVHKRHAAFDGGEVCHRGEVHDLLDAAGGQHGEARLAARHDVGVVAEDGQGLGGKGAG